MDLKREFDSDEASDETPKQFPEPKTVARASHATYESDAEAVPSEVGREATNSHKNNNSNNHYSELGPNICSAESLLEQRIRERGESRETTDLIEEIEALKKRIERKQRYSHMSPARQALIRYGLGFIRNLFDEEELFHGAGRDLELRRSDESGDMPSGWSVPSLSGEIPPSSVGRLMPYDARTVRSRQQGGATQSARNAIDLDAVHRLFFLLNILDMNTAQLSEETNIPEETVREYLHESHALLSHVHTMAERVRYAGRILLDYLERKYSDLVNDMEEMEVASGGGEGDGDEETPSLGESNLETERVGETIER